MERESRGPEAGAFDSDLRDDEIHVWRQPIGLLDQELESLWEILSTDERHRAERYRFDASRRTFVVCRGMLRIMLSGYLKKPPSQLEFTYTKYGRPELSLAGEENNLDFNISHAEDLAVLGFSRKRRIGIDVEKVRRDFDTSEIAEHFFSECERRELRQTPKDESHEAFFRCWTRKEAFIKALGEGLSHPLDSFDVSIERGSRPKLLATRPDVNEAARWSLWAVTVPTGYVAALAAERGFRSESQTVTF